MYVWNRSLDSSQRWSNSIWGIYAVTPQIVIGETSNQGFGEVRPDDALHFLEVFSGYLAIPYCLNLKDCLI